MTDQSKPNEDALNAPPPTLDATEGAGDLRKDINLIWATLDRAAMASRSHRVPPQVTRALNRIEAALDEAAPPKPAPDAIREALAVIARDSEGLLQAVRAGDTKAQLMIHIGGLMVDVDKAFSLSAPVPSPDLLALAQAAIERQKDTPLNIDALAANLVAAGEFEGTGAAEPVAVCPSCGWLFHPEVATPSVRGNREAIARAIFKNHQHLSDEDVDRWFKIYADKPEGVDHFRMAIWRAYSDADAILSLPVQSTAR